MRVNTFNTLNVAGSAAVQNLSLGGGTLTGPGDLTVNGTLSWANGAITGTGLLRNNGTFAVPGPFSVTLNRRVDNAGTATVAGFTTLSLGANVVWTNLPGSSFVFLGDGSLAAAPFVSGMHFDNAGLVRKAGGAGTSTFSAPFTNNGTVEVRSGTLSFTGAVSNLSGTTLTGGAWVVVGPAAPVNLRITGADVRTNAAAIVLDGANANIVNQVGQNAPSPADQAAGFTFLVDWGDGSSETVSAPSGAEVEHVYAEAGTYTVGLTATDKDGDSGFASTSITITVVALQGNELVVGGTTGSDVILFTPAAGDRVRVLIDGESQGTFEGVGRVVAFGQAGDDVLLVAGLDLPAELYGGDGNDLLTAGHGNAILDGDDGNDILIGGRGRDVMVGGAGHDLLVGAAGDDILIGGHFRKDDGFSARRQALQQVMAEWSSADSYEDRAAAAIALILPHADDDGATDLLTGASGTDLFFAGLGGLFGDVVLGANRSEQVIRVS